MCSTKMHTHTKLGRKPIFMGKFMARFLMAVAQSGFQSRVGCIVWPWTKPGPLSVQLLPLFCLSVLLILTVLCNKVLLHLYSTQKKENRIAAEVLSFMLLRKQGAKVSEVKGFLKTEMKNQEKDEIIKQGNRKQMLHHSSKKGGMPLAMGTVESHPLCPLHYSVYHAARPDLSI